MFTYEERRETMEEFFEIISLWKLPNNTFFTLHERNGNASNIFQRCHVMEAKAILLLAVRLLLQLKRISLSLSCQVLISFSFSSFRSDMPASNVFRTSSLCPISSRAIVFASSRSTSTISSLCLPPGDTRLRTHRLGGRRSHPPRISSDSSRNAIRLMTQSRIQVVTVMVIGRRTEVG